MAKITNTPSNISSRAVADVPYLLLVGLQTGPATDNQCGKSSASQTCIYHGTQRSHSLISAKEQHPASTDPAMLAAAPFTVAKKYKQPTFFQQMSNEDAVHRPYGILLSC